MPAIKLKKVTADYLAQKEKEGKKQGDKAKNEKKNLEDVADDDEQSKDEEDVKPYNFLDVELLFDKRKRTVPVPEQKLIEWIEDNLEKKEDVNISLVALYEYYTETCKLQGVSVVDIPVFNKHMKEKLGKTFGFKDASPYKGLLKEKKIKEKKPHVKGETLAIKIKDIIHEVITAAGNPKRGVRFHNLKMTISAKYPALRVDLYPLKLRGALERGMRFGHIELVRGVGRSGFYRLPGESTLDEDKEDKKDKKKKKSEGEGEEGKKEGDVTENGADTSETDDSKTEEGGTKRKKEDDKEGEGEPPKKKQKKKKKPKKKKEIWGRGEASKHSDPQKVEHAFPLAITYQSDPKEASGSKIKMYIAKHYGECNAERLKKSLESGIEKGLWEQTRGSGVGGTFHLLIDTFNPSRSDTMDDRIAQAIVATHEPKQASALLIKKYIGEYHPNLNTESRPHLFKHALERASQKGTIRQVTGIGASGSFLLVDHFYPSPAILAGESEDEFEESEDEYEEVEKYIPRPTKRSRAIAAPSSRPKADRSAPPQKKKKVIKQAAKPSTPAKGKSKLKKAPKGRKSPKSRAIVDVSSDEEFEDEVGDSYVPRPTKRGRGAPDEKTTPAKTPKKAPPAKAAPPAKKGKSKGKASGKPEAKSSTPAKAGKNPAKSTKKRR